MEDQIKKFIGLLVKFYESVKDKQKLSPDESEKFNNICKDLFEGLISNPGGLIFIEETERIDAYKFSIERLFELHSYEEIYDDLVQGGYNGLMFEEMDNYAYRAQQLRPTLISVKPENKEFYTYYDEAMKCWLYGLNNSSIIIIATLLESTLKNKLKNIGQNELQVMRKQIRSEKKQKRNQIDFEDFIDIAKVQGFLSNISKISSHRLRKKRNNIVHNRLEISSDEALELINSTKNIFEDVYN